MLHQKVDDQPIPIPLIAQCQTCTATARAASAATLLRLYYDHLLCPQTQEMIATLDPSDYNVSIQRHTH